MDTNNGFDFSWSGFIDYNPCYYKQSVFSIIVGVCIWLGTALSIVPQIVRIVRLRSSQGISPLYSFCTNFSQSLVVLNIYLLHNADFFGLLQVNFWESIPRFLTFLSNLSLYYVYNPVTFMLTIFFYYEEKKKPHAWLLSCLVTVLNTVFPIILYYVFVQISLYLGLSCSTIRLYARTLGIISSCFNVVQYIPQFITSCKLRDNGSFSLVMLLIQAPGGSINVIYMALSGEDWSMWMPMLVSVLEQWALLCMLIIFKLQKRRKLRSGVESLDSEPLLATTSDFQ